jgi:hypothetical protein
MYRVPIVLYRKVIEGFIVIEKRARSLKINSNVDDKLVALCERLGVTVNAYIVGEIGKSVNRDFLAFQVAQNQEDTLNKMLLAFEEQMNKTDSE